MDKWIKTADNDIINVSRVDKFELIRSFDHDSECEAGIVAHINDVEHGLIGFKKYEDCEKFFNEDLINFLSDSNNNVLVFKEV